MWTLLGFCTYAIVAVANYKIFLSYAHILYALGIAGLLLARPESPFSVEMMGARRWVDLGITTVQPTEAAKMGTLIMASSILARSKVGSISESILVIAKVALIFLLPMWLIFMQPDLGSSLVFPPMIFALLYLSLIHI